MRRKLSILFFSFACSQAYVGSPAPAVNVGPALLTSLVDTDPCPRGSVLVDGDYCPQVEEVCTKHVDALGRPDAPPADGSLGRCAEFRFPTRCMSATKVHVRFCIDVYEYPNIAGQIPQSWMTWYDAKAACEAKGSRLCTRSEWTFACEGPDMKPYPYGDGYHRDRTACNFDNSTAGVNVTADTKTKRELDSFLVPSGSNPRCVSPFGVHEMVGNIDEFVVNETGRPYKSGLMSGHVFGVRNACRPMTDGHAEAFAWYETGTRCCASVNDGTTTR